MKQLAVSNNTSGASIYDLGGIIQSESLAELQHVLKKTEEKAMQQRQEQMQHEQQMKEMEMQQRTEERQMMLDAEMAEAEKNRRKDILVAEIRSAGYGAMQDINQNLQSDYMDALGKIQETEQYQDTMSLQRQKQSTKENHDREKLNVERQKLQVQQDIANKQLEIARVNKNRFDTKEPKEKKTKR
jgi:hypothetical protein